MREREIGREAGEMEKKRIAMGSSMIESNIFSFHLDLYKSPSSSSSSSSASFSYPLASSLPSALPVVPEGIFEDRFTFFFFFQGKTILELLFVCHFECFIFL